MSLIPAAALPVKVSKISQTNPSRAYEAYKKDISPHV